MRWCNIREASDDLIRIHETALAAQAAALAEIRPSAPAEVAFAAANEIYRSRGYAAGYRAGRGIGLSYREPPDLKTGDTTPLQEGMTLAVDGGVSVPGRFAARISDSIVVTRDGFELLTPCPPTLSIV